MAYLFTHPNGSPSTEPRANTAGFDCSHAADEPPTIRHEFGKLTVFRVRPVLATVSS